MGSGKMNINLFLSLRIFPKYCDNKGNLKVLIGMNWEYKNSQEKIIYGSKSRLIF